MKIIRTAIFSVFALVAADSAVAADYKPSTDGKALPENMHVASMCAKGFSIAVHFFGNEQRDVSQKELIVHMAKSVCIEDNFVISIYNALKNSSKPKTLDESRAFAEEMVTTWVTGNLDVLEKTKKQRRSKSEEK